MSDPSAQIHSAPASIFGKLPRYESPLCGFSTLALGHSESSKSAVNHPATSVTLHFHVASVSIPVEVEARIPSSYKLSVARKAITHGLVRVSIPVSNQVTFIKTAPLSSKTSIKSSTAIVSVISVRIRKVKQIGVIYSSNVLTN